MFCRQKICRQFVDILKLKRTVFNVDDRFKFQNDDSKIGEMIWKQTNNIQQ